MKEWFLMSNSDLTGEMIILFSSIHHWILTTLSSVVYVSSLTLRSNYTYFSKMHTKFKRTAFILYNLVVFKLKNDLKQSGWVSSFIMIFNHNDWIFKSTPYTNRIFFLCYCSLKGWQIISGQQTYFTVQHKISWPKELQKEKITHFSKVEKNCYFFFKYFSISMSDSTPSMPYLLHTDILQFTHLSLDLNTWR